MLTLAVANVRSRKASFTGAFIAITLAATINDPDGTLIGAQSMAATTTATATRSRFA